MNLLDLVADAGADDTALIVPESDVHLTYGALEGQVEVLAGALAEAGVRRGDRIAVALPNGPALVVAVFAASTMGVAVPLNVAGDEGELASAVDDSGASALIVLGDSPHGVPTVKPLRAHGTVSTHKESVPESVPEPVPKSVPKSVPDSVPDSVPFDVSSHDIAVVLQTRGTTGRPRRVPLSHANLTISARNIAATLGLDANDVSLCIMPIGHVHGLVAGTLATLATGGTVVIPGAFHPLAFWRVARDYGVTWYTAAPTLHQWLLARTADPGTRRPAGAARLRFIRSSGSTLPPLVSQTLESAFGVPVIEAYDVTEAAGQVASTPLPASPPVSASTSVPSRTPGRVGRPTAARVQVIDDEGRPLPTGQRGEVVLAGPSVARSYDNDPAATRKFFVDGWFRTGDLGYLDADGSLTLTGVRVQS